MGLRVFPPPPFASQGKAPHCWAACTTSWLAVNKDRPPLNLRQLVDRYGDPKKDGGISFQDEKYELLRSDLRWTNTEHATVVLANPTRHQLTLPEFTVVVARTIQTRGHILLVDNHTPGSILSQGISHMYVVHGVLNVSGGGHELLVMDPSSSARTRVSVAEFANHRIVMLGTKEVLATRKRKDIEVKETFE